MKSSILIGICAIAVTALGNINTAQEKAQDEQDFIIRSDVPVVEIKVVATLSDGLPVTDLAANELYLSDNGKEQTITGFERLTGDNLLESLNAEHLNGEVEPEKVSNPRAHQHSILLLDALNTNWSDQLYTRQQAVNVLEELPGNEQVAIFALSNQLQLLHDFSSDSDSLRNLVQCFSGEQALLGEASENDFSFSDLLQPPEARSGPEAAFYQRRRILMTLEALTTIARLMRDLPGQKSLFWLSAGFPLALSAADGRFIRDADRQPGTPKANGSRVAVTPPDEMFHDNVKTMAQEMSASNLAIYPIDARGLLPNPGVLVNINTMKEIAEETGGKAYYNDNDLTALVRAAIKDSQEGYVLTFIPSDFEADGSFHRIQLQTDRHGIKLRYRPGYYAEAKHR